MRSRTSRFHKQKQRVCSSNLWYYQAEYWIWKIFCRICSQCRWLSSPAASSSVDWIRAGMSSLMRLSIIRFQSVTRPMMTFIWNGSPIWIWSSNSEFKWKLYQNWYVNTFLLLIEESIKIWETTEASERSAIAISSPGSFKLSIILLSQ